ncbi:MAG: hypothetical protein H7061_07275 [Bdellovibrionaceae bacterium]|nr:hypothetical protein [Bdellovibrio sp.]
MNIFLPKRYFTFFISQILFSVLLSVQAFALESLKINTGHYVAFEKYDGAGNESPTLILLPGVNRGIDSRDLFINMLRRQKELAKNYKFQFIIETAPMIRFHESDPEGSQTAAICKNWLSLYPGFGSILSRTLLKQAYGQYWSAKVDKMISENPRYQQIPNFKNLMI